MRAAGETGRWSRDRARRGRRGHHDLGPALAAEVAGVPVATLVPHVYPNGARLPGLLAGRALPRTGSGRGSGSARNDALHGAGLEQGRDQLNESRRRLDLPPRDGLHTGLSR